MAVVTPAARLITGEELARMPGGELCELVEGRIVPVSPPAGSSIVSSLRNAFRMLDAFARHARLGRVLTGEVGFYTRRDPDTVRGADVVFISTERYGRRTRTLTFLDVRPGGGRRSAVRSGHGDGPDRQASANTSPPR